MTLGVAGLVRKTIPFFQENASICMATGMAVLLSGVYFIREGQRLQRSWNRSNYNNIRA